MSVCSHGQRGSLDPLHLLHREETDIDTQPPTTDRRSSFDFYTLRDLLAYWERGEMTLEEVITHWPHDYATSDELLRELLEALIGLMRRIMILKGKTVK